MSGRMVNHAQITVAEYEDGSVRCTHSVLDQVSRRVVPATLFHAQQSKEDPWTHAELFLIGAAELLARQMGIEYPLPF